MNEQEKIYRTLGSTGVTSFVVGVIVLVTGLASGVLLIVNGARLLSRKKKILI